MKQLILTCGIPGSGKSTFIMNHNFGLNTKVISRDNIRFSLLTEKDEYFSKEKEVWKEYVNNIKDALYHNSDDDIVIADATHLNKMSRLKIINALGDSLKGVEVNVLVMKTPLPLALSRNNKRVGRHFVPPEQIQKMSLNFTVPTFEEYNYNHIYIYEEQCNPKLKIIEKG